MIITAVLFGFNIYGTLMLEQNFDRASFLPSDSMSYRYTVASDKVRYFNRRKYQFSNGYIFRRAVVIRLNFWIDMLHLPYYH